MRNQENATPTIDFYEAQGNVGDPYFVYTIQDGEQAGGGVSCYFWYASPDQFFRSLNAHGDFWQWSDSWEVASGAIRDIVQSSSDSETILSSLSSYMSSNAGVDIYAWGEFDELLSGNDPFSSEVRTEFREHRWADDEADEENQGRPISSDELEAFCEYLSETPT